MQRTKDDLGKTDRWGLMWWSLIFCASFLKAAAGYEIHYRTGEAGWKFRHRYHFDGNASTRVQSRRFHFVSVFNILTAVAMSFAGVLAC